MTYLVENRPQLLIFGIICLLIINIHKQTEAQLMIRNRLWWETGEFVYLNLFLLFVPY